MEDKRFTNLPAELQLKIWELATPARIVEVAEPGDPEVEPAEDLKKAWLLNRKVPPTAHVCFDSRSITTAKPNLGDSPVDTSKLDPRWLWKSTAIIHFNCPKELPKDSNGTREINERLRDMRLVPLLGKKVSLSADLLHPFMRDDCCPIDWKNIWDSFVTLGFCFVSLRTILIRATKEQARERGLFGGGEEPAKLVDLFDDDLIDQYRALWMDTQNHGPNEMSATAFFQALGTKRFRYRIDRWFAGVAVNYLQYQFLVSTFTAQPPALRVVFAQLVRNPASRHSPRMRERLKGLPVIEMRIMFRLCPP
ncbi:hypothetical protein N7535_008719 [Penicillium sp. DV-2018c]|nr:hypothetical protein N7535_008719 [Penicillium sp. DV-2018c]